MEKSFFCDYLPTVTRNCAYVIEDFDKMSAVHALKKILPYFGLTLKFHWTETIIDIAYQFPQFIDLYKRFTIGPGSIPTMSRLNSSVFPEDTCQSLMSLGIPTFPYLTYEGKTIWLSTENWEGIGCVFRKYTNLESGTGRKRLYTNK